MGKYKLTYFEGRARAEVSRMLFALAGEKYEDNRVSQDTFKKLKSELLFGQLPTLETDGEVIYQSRAIERFLARKFGLAGKTEMEQVKVDMVMECMEDSVSPLRGIFSEKDDAKKAEMIKKWNEEDYPAFLAGLEKLLTKNKGGDGFFVGDKVTVADLSVIQMMTLPNMLGVFAKFEKYPKLKAHKARVEAIPKIAEWIAKRPKTDF